MKQSDFFTKTSKTAPEGEEAINAKLLIRAGFIAKASAGVYSLLPLGFRVLNRVNAIIRQEMNAIGGEELLMPSLIDKKYWEKSDRWGTDIIYKTGKQKGNSRGNDEAHDFEYGLGWTHEEVIASIARNFIQSYKDLPKAVYQIQTKFRAEVRSQGGLLRGREFMMKDLYSFHTDVADLERYYDVAMKAYERIFKRLGLKTIIAEASGGAFTKEYTHEFQVLNPAGEDTVHYCRTCGFAQNKEVFDASRHLPAGRQGKNCKGAIEVVRGIEVGNIFRLGTKFSEAFGLLYADEKGAKHPVVMGSYGIGPTRAMAAIVEVSNDDRGIIWPEAVAPFAVHLLELSSEKSEVRKTAEKIYGQLQKAEIPVLYDDRRDVSAGAKFADADLIGIPYRAVISEKTVPKVEVKKRSEQRTQMVPIKELIEIINRK